LNIKKIITYDVGNPGQNWFYKYEIIARIWFPYFVPGRWDPINRFNPSTFLAHLA
jgi:hypothetical protein